MRKALDTLWFKQADVESMGKGSLHALPHHTQV